MSRPCILEWPKLIFRVPEDPSIYFFRRLKGAVFYFSLSFLFIVICIWWKSLIKQIPEHINLETPIMRRQSSNRSPTAKAKPVNVSHLIPRQESAGVHATACPTILNQRNYSFLTSHTTAGRPLGRISPNGLLEGRVSNRSQRSSRLATSRLYPASEYDPLPMRIATTVNMYPSDPEAFNHGLHFTNWSMHQFISRHSDGNVYHPRYTHPSAPPFLTLALLAALPDDSRSFVIGYTELVPIRFSKSFPPSGWWGKFTLIHSEDLYILSSFSHQSWPCQHSLLPLSHRVENLMASKSSLQPLTPLMEGPWTSLSFPQSRNDTLEYGPLMLATLDLGYSFDGRVFSLDISRTFSRSENSLLRTCHSSLQTPSNTPLGLGYQTRFPLAEPTQGIRKTVFTTIQAGIANSSYSAAAEKMLNRECAQYQRSAIRYIRIHRSCMGHGHPDLSKKLMRTSPTSDRRRSVIEGHLVRTPKRSEKRSHEKGGMKNMGTCAPYTRREGFTPLMKTPKEILAMDNVNFPPPPPMSLRKNCVASFVKDNSKGQKGRRAHPKEKHTRLSHDDIPKCNRKMAPTREVWSTGCIRDNIPVIAFSISIMNCPSAIRILTTDEVEAERISNTLVDSSREKSITVPDNALLSRRGWRTYELVGLHYPLPMMKSNFRTVSHYSRLLREDSKKCRQIEVNPRLKYDMRQAPDPYTAADKARKWLT
ncbi:hypothetical protein Tco_0196098 [Tanacetum coccineum]